MRRLYTLLLYLALPFLALRMWVRAWREGVPLSGWSERLGGGQRLAGGVGVWIHAASVGEVQVAASLIEALRARTPSLLLSLSCVTPAGRARARALLPAVDVRYAPYDLPACVRRCLARLRPRLLIVIETELWPNLFNECYRAGVPTLLASARVSVRTARLYGRLPGLLRAALCENVWVGAQSELDAQRFRSLGAAPERVSLLGNIKFDRTLAPDVESRGASLRQRYGEGRPMWTAGSTHEGEEQILLAAHRQLRASLPQALLVLAPRHPARFEAAAAAIESDGWHLARRSRALPRGPYEVLLLDTLGELVDFYAAADLAFVGGSLVPIGGHNLLEPAALGRAVLSGPYQFSAPDIAQVLEQQGGLVTVHNASELAAALARLLADPVARADLGARARAALEANRGALARLLQLIDALGAPSG